MTSREAFEAAVCASLSETAWQRHVCELATALGWRFYHTHDSRRSNPGFPDLVLIKPPRALFVEIKRERGRLTRDQQWWLAALADCGLTSHVWRPSDREAVLDMLR